MRPTKWEEGREEREKQGLAFHARMASLYREDRLAFERERRRLVNEVINGAQTDVAKQKLRALQDSIDKKLRGARSEHNRFILMQKLFWEQVDVFREVLSRI